MRRYKNIQKEEIFTAWNRLRNALLAARDGNEVDEIMKALFTSEEKFQLGRRIMVVECLKQEMTNQEIRELLGVGMSTISHVSNRLNKYPRGFELIERRSRKVEKEYGSKKYQKTGGSKLVFKKKTYSGRTRKDVKR